MRSHLLNTVACLTTATLVSSSLAVEVKAAVFAVDSGITSVFLDFENVLEPALGITLVGAEGIVDPATGPFQVGFTITPETDFTFSDDGGFTPIGGTIEHTGSVTLGIMTGATEPTNVTVGNFTIGYDADRVSEQTTGFFVQDNLDLGAILFDVAAPVATFEFEGQDLALGSNLAVSPEFASVLVSLGKPDVTGAVAGAAQVNARVQEQKLPPDHEPTSVPEPIGVMGLLLTAVAGWVGRHRFNPRAV